MIWNWIAGNTRYWRPDEGSVTTIRHWKAGPIVLSLYDWCPVASLSCARWSVGMLAFCNGGLSIFFGENVRTGDNRWIDLW